MGAKKKVEPPPQKPVPPQPENRIRSVQLQDGSQYKIADSLLVRHSAHLKNIIGQQKTLQQIKIPDSSKGQFQFIHEFLIMHSDKEPQALHLPLQSNQGLSFVLKAEDADLIHRIIAKGHHFVKGLLDLVRYLEIEELKRRILAGLTIHLLNKTVEELQDEYQLPDAHFGDEELRADIKDRLEGLKKMDLD